MRLFSNARSRSVRLRVSAPAEAAGDSGLGPGSCPEVAGRLELSPCPVCWAGATKRTGAAGAFGCNRAISCRGMGLPPLARIAVNCRSRDADAGGGTARATTDRFNSPGGSRRTLRPASPAGPNTLCRTGAIAGGAEVGVM